MKNLVKFGFLASVVSFAGIVACSAQPGPTDDGAKESVGQSAEALSTCSSDCCGTGGPALSKSCNSCSSDSVSVTCDGVRYACQAPACQSNTCTSTSPCTAAGYNGVAISCTGSTGTCSSTASSVTCNGVTTVCKPAGSGSSSGGGGACGSCRAGTSCKCGDGICRPANSLCP